MGLTWGPQQRTSSSYMTKPSFEADGAAPFGAGTRAVFRPAKQIRTGLSALPALAVVGPQPDGPRRRSGEIAAPAPASVVRPLIPPEALAGPPRRPPWRRTPNRSSRLCWSRPACGPRSICAGCRGTRRGRSTPRCRRPLTPDLAQPFRLDVGAKNGRQALHCLTQAAYFEAGANGPDAQAAVVQVVLNRLRHPDFPKSVCGVVYEGAGRDTGCQFTFTCDGSLGRPVDATAWDEARKVAGRALGGYVDRAVGTATYYHADYVFPAWAPTLVKMATVGPHIFYRMAGPEGAAAYLTGQYAGNELKLVRAVLRAADKHTQKANPAVEAQVQPASIPAGLRSGTSRLQRVRVEIAASPPRADQTPIVETASLQGSIHATLQAGSAAFDSAGARHRSWPRQPSMRRLLRPPSRRRSPGSLPG